MIDDPWSRDIIDMIGNGRVVRIEMLHGFDHQNFLALKSIPASVKALGWTFWLRFV